VENKTAAILVLLLVAAVAITAGGVYAMGWQGGSGTGTASGYGMMGGLTGYRGGMMAGHGMMGSTNGPSGMLQYMKQYMERCLNSTWVP